MPNGPTIVIPRTGLEAARIGHRFVVAVGDQERHGTIEDLAEIPGDGLCFTGRFDD
ncbi:MAG: hypothetical protein HYR89_03520 [Actinobacteria bacterium]|nr:hypothetical protein [Actinomycetota bacterium]